MGIVPIAFNFKRENTLLPIITVTGISKNMLETERAMLKIAVEIIEMAETKLKGKVISSMGHDESNEVGEGMMSVKCYILFKNEDELAEAVLRIKKELG